MNGCRDCKFQHWDKLTYVVCISCVRNLHTKQHSRRLGKYQQERKDNYKKGDGA